MLLLPYIYRLALLLMSGALWGLIPLLVGKATGKPELGKIGMLCSILTNVIYLGIVSAVGFLIAILVRQEDIGKSASPAAPVNVYYSAPPTAPAQKAVVVEKPVGGLDLFCVSGPLRGQVYPVGPSGLLIGRSPNCGVRLPDGTPGISREHCAIRFQQGVPVFDIAGIGQRIDSHRTQCDGYLTGTFYIAGSPAGKLTRVRLKIRQE